MKHPPTFQATELRRPVPAFQPRHAAAQAAGDFDPWRGHLGPTGPTPESSARSRETLAPDSPNPEPETTKIRPLVGEVETTKR